MRNLLMNDIKRGPVIFALIIGMFVTALNETLMGNLLLPFPN